jgi:hypothetical protein
MNKKCPQIASFLFISENRTQEHLFYLVFEFGSQRISPGDMTRHFTKVIDTLLKGLVFMESIQLFYPHVSLGNIIKVSPEVGTNKYPEFKLINQFCFQEVFRFVVEYLLNVKISEKKKMGILEEMKRKSLREFRNLIEDFRRKNANLCSVPGPLSNVGKLLDFVTQVLKLEFTFKDIHDRFLSLFETVENVNKGYLPSLRSEPSTSIKQVPPRSQMKTLSKSGKNSITLSGKDSTYTSNNPRKYITQQNNNGTKRYVLSNKYSSNPRTVSKAALSYTSNMNTSLLPDNSSELSLNSSSNMVSKKGFQRQLSKNSKKFVIEHKKRSSGFYSMNDNKLDDLTVGTRFSEIPSRDQEPRTTLQRNFMVPSPKNTDARKPLNIFKKKDSINSNLFYKNETRENETNKDDSLYYVIQGDDEVKKVMSKVNKTMSPNPKKKIISNRSTLMTQVHDEYNFHENTSNLSDIRESKRSKDTVPLVNRHFSFSKQGNLNLENMEKKNIKEFINDNGKSPKIKKKSLERRPTEKLRIARMSENLYHSASKQLESSSIKHNKEISANDLKSPRGTGLRRSSSSSFIKKENEELKKKQMKRSIFNLQRQEKNDGVKKYGTSKNKTLKLKSHIERWMTKEANQFAPQYLDFGDCPAYCYRIIVSKSDNNALADKRFFNNPRNFYSPEMLINLNTCQEQIRQNISGQIIQGLKTSQMNEVTRLRMTSKYIDFEGLVNFDSHLKSSMYHNLEDLEEDFDLAEEVKEEAPKKPFFINQEQVEKIDDVTFKMNGIEFKDLRGQKNVNVDALKNKINSNFSKNYQSNPKIIRKPENRAIRRGKPQREMNSREIQSKYNTVGGKSNGRVSRNFTNLNNSSSNYYGKYTQNETQQKINDRIVSHLNNRVIRPNNNRRINGDYKSVGRKYFTNQPSSYLLNSCKLI